MSVNNSLEFNSSSVYLTGREITKRAPLDDIGSKLAEKENVAAVDSNESAGNVVPSENIIKTKANLNYPCHGLGDLWDVRSFLQPWPSPLVR